MVMAKEQKDTSKKWWRRVEQSREERNKHTETWDLMVKSYLPKVTAFGLAEDTKSNAHFRNVEQKKPQLFFRNPELKLIPKMAMEQPPTGPDGQPIMGAPGPDGQPQPLSMDDAVAVHQEVLNYYMGPNEVDLPLLMDRLLFDCLCPSGMMVSKIHYQPYFVEEEVPVMEQVPDPMTGQMIEQPQVNPLTGEPETTKEPVLITEKFCWDRVSPRKLLKPREFKDTDFRHAPWLGIEFQMPLREAKRLYNKLPKDFKGSKGAGQDNDRLIGTDNKIDSDEEVVAGVEIFYKGHLYRDDVIHPDVYWHLVLIDGVSENKSKQFAVVDRLCPFQELDESGQLTLDSMLGNPIHVGTLRDVTDRSYVPSDCQMTHVLVKEIDTYRAQTVKLRDANITKFGYDVQKVTKDQLAAIEQGDVGAFIAFQPGALNQGMDKAIAPITKGTNTRTDMEGVFALEQDLEKTLAIGANQAGGTSNTARTATELSIIQDNVNVRLKKEQQRCVAYVLSGIRKFDSLLQRFADNNDVVRIVGQGNVPRLQAWNKTVLAGRFAYDIVPDSQLELDAATERNLFMQYYNLTAQDPFNNRQESLKKLQRLFGVDPTKGMQQPPEPGPPPPNVSFRFAGEDLYNPMVREIIAQAGYNISPETVNEAMALQGAREALEQSQPPVDGTAEKIPAISKKQDESTGKLTGPTDQGQG